MKKDDQTTNLSAILNYINDMVLYCSPDFKVLESNSAADVILGGGDSIVGSKCHELLHQKTEPCSDCPLEATISSGRLKHLNYFNESIDEYFEERTHPIIEDGHQRGFVLMCRNVSEIREIEDKFAQDKKMVAIGQISSGVAHDFSNVIMGILGRIKIMRMTLNIPELEEQFELLERSAQDGAETVRRMQEFTRAWKETAFVDINLPELINEVIALTRPKWRQAAKKDGRLVEVTCDLEDNVYISGNTSELHNALTNLIFNAVDAMPDGGFISVKCRKKNDQVLMQVKDTGIGMTDEILEKIFDPFFTTKGSEGNGLGMSEVYGVVKRHSGTIEVQSDVGEGTTFTLTFPVHIPEKVKEEEVALEVGSLRILAVDDDEFILEFFEDVFREIGHITTAYQSPVEAIENFDPRKYDMVITDLEMPVMNGQEFAEKIKAVAPQIPIILLSGWFIDLNEEKDLAMAIDCTITKPFTVEEIQRAIAKAYYSVKK